MLEEWLRLIKDKNFNKWKSNLAIVLVIIHFATINQRLSNEIELDKKEKKGDLADRKEESKQIKENERKYLDKRFRKKQIGSYPTHVANPNYILSYYQNYYCIDDQKLIFHF